jgi:ABC-type multidrug transport system ATPase subunit|tara:strand:+ start:234 stop:1088 length:855 start_codon:yes stop_codon:yes gene_type:complete
MIQIEGLTKKFKKNVVLNNISFSIDAGEAVALWGTNGAGKTTIIRCILGLLNYEGSIELNGLDIQRYPKDARSIVGYVPQEVTFYGDLTVAETLNLSAQLRHISQDQVSQTLDLVSLGNQKGKKVRELSGGMQQRLGMAVALLGNPPILLLDEPTSSLDVDSRRQMVSLLDSLRGPDRVLVITSHRVEEVGMLVDRVLALEDGQIIDECSPADLSSRQNLPSWLHVVLRPDEITEALQTLILEGFEAQLNGYGLLVNVDKDDKASVLNHLQKASFEIMDFEVWR